MNRIRPTVPVPNSLGGTGNDDGEHAVTPVRRRPLADVRRTRRSGPSDSHASPQRSSWTDTGHAAWRASVLPAGRALTEQDRVSVAVPSPTSFAVKTEPPPTAALGPYPGSARKLRFLRTSTRVVLHDRETGMTEKRVTFPTPIHPGTLLLLERAEVRWPLLPLCSGGVSGCDSS
jgi:hypothetical protein